VSSLSDQLAGLMSANPEGITTGALCWVLDRPRSSVKNRLRHWKGRRWRIGGWVLNGGPREAFWVLGPGPDAPRPAPLLPRERGLKRDPIPVVPVSSPADDRARCYDPTNPLLTLGVMR